MLACAILHNWVLQYGEDEYFPPEKTCDPEPNDEDHNDIVHANISWAHKRDEFANQIWANRGLANI